MAKVLHPVIDCNPRVVYEADVFWSFVLLDFGDRTKTAVAPTPGTLLEFWWTFGGLGQGLLTDPFLCHGERTAASSCATPRTRAVMKGTKLSVLEQNQRAEF